MSVPGVDFSCVHRAGPEGSFPFISRIFQSSHRQMFLRISRNHLEIVFSSYTNFALGSFLVGIQFIQAIQSDGFR